MMPRHDTLSACLHRAPDDVAGAACPSFLNICKDTFAYLDKTFHNPFYILSKSFRLRDRVPLDC